MKTEQDITIQDIEDYKSYLGNSNLKRKGVEISWTAEMLTEIKRCAKDPMYFSEKYIKIVHVDHGFIPMKLYDYQRAIIESCTNNRRTTVVTARQAGKTTTAVCLILHYILFNNYKLVALLANKGDAAREILDRIKVAYEALPKWLQQGVIEWNKGSVEFENKSKIIAAATSSSAIRGKSVSFLYIDETAFVEGWDQFFSAVMPTISSGTTTKTLFTSTPNGLNHFYKTCDSAKRGINGYQYIEVKWDMVPGRGEDWRQETLAGMDFDQQRFAQEYECEFQGSSGTLISGWKLKQLVYKEPVRQIADVNFFYEPEEGHNYVVVVDVSRGKGLDYSALQIIDVTEMPYKQAATYKNNMITPVDFASVLHRIAIHYNMASVLIEVNDIGDQVASLMFDEFEYENMLLTENNGREGKRLISGVAGFSGKADKGIRTTKPVKSIGCSMLKLLIEQDQLIINDFETIGELSTFSKKGNSFEAEQGRHDDLVMGLVLFGWLTNQKFFKELTDINTVINLKEMNDEQIFSELTPFGFIDNGQSNFEEAQPVVVDGDDYNWLA